ncbi:MAG: hypothetical protein ACRDVM_10300, partial [Acidimicrobiia bacterium]
SDEISLVTIFDGRELNSSAGSFRGGSSLTVFGGTEIDLRGAHLAEEGAHQELTTLLAGTEVIVPDTWRVVMHGVAVGGGVDRRLPQPETLASDAPRLTISSRTFLGGLMVTARPPAR